jgi:hypothetical protein
MSKNENAQSARVVRDDELDFVSAGHKDWKEVLDRRLELENTMVSN